jgi:hypothetical protein
MEFGLLQSSRHMSYLLYSSSRRTLQQEKSEKPWGLRQISIAISLFQTSMAILSNVSDTKSEFEAYVKFHIFSSAY